MVFKLLYQLTKPQPEVVQDIVETDKAVQTASRIISDMVEDGHLDPDLATTQQTIMLLTYEKCERMLDVIEENPSSNIMFVDPEAQ